jgi:hypothetical protein
MVQEGVQGIREYYKVKKDIAKTQAILKVAQKKYEATVKLQLELVIFLSISKSHNTRGISLFQSRRCGAVLRL